jgi:HEAT repeat protein
LLAEVDRNELFMSGSMLHNLVKRARQALLSLRERPSVAADEVVLEHMLLYHGLIGSSPENQREFRDVRSDTLAAIEHKSVSTLAIALKLAPLWWEDKLKSVFAELSEAKKALASELLIGYSEEVPENRPISHSDWRVRSNAAILLGFLGIETASKPLADLLSDTSDSGRMSFCYVSRSLGKLQTEEGKLALAQHVHNPEPWFRVDVAAALSCYPLAPVRAPVVNALKGERELKDYMAVAVARNHLPLEFISSGDEQLREGGCELVIGILQAASNTFSEDIVFETHLTECLMPLLDLALSKPDPLPVTATLNLLDWLLLKAQPGTKASFSTSNLTAPATLASQIAQVSKSYLNTDVMETLKALLNKANFQRPEQLSSLRCALQLAGRLQLRNTEPLLKKALKSNFPLLPELIETLGAIGEPTTIQPLLELAGSIVDLDERIQLPKSKQPVTEQSIRDAKIYWTILGALKKFESEEVVKFLLKATDDYAPDKRAQALSSLTAVLMKNEQLKARFDLTKVIGEGLRDPSPLVQLAALRGAALSGSASNISDIVRLIDAQENTVSKESFQALSELSRQGYAQEVSELVRPKLKQQRQEHKRRQIEELLSVTSRVT